MEQVSEWLETLGLSKHVKLFKENEIDFDVLPDLNDQDLKELGLPLGPRKKILKAISRITDPNPVEYSTVNSLPSPTTSPDAFTPHHIAKKILGARGTVEGELKQVTVLFADIKGSTQIIETLDAEQASQLFDPVLHVLMDAVHQFEGTVNRIQGDGLMALFGAPLAHEDHAMRACYSALIMQSEVKKLAQENPLEGIDPIQIRVGLNSGEVVVRGINNDLSMNYDAVGMTAHLAARMEQNAPPGGIYLTADTARLTEGLVDAESKEAIQVKGVTEPVSIFQLRGTTTQRTRWQVALARGLGDFVGRDSPMKVLVDALEQSAQGHGQLVALVGEAGVGKSRLVHEFTQSSSVDGWQVLAGSSVSYGKASDWLPVIDLCRAYFGIADEDGPQTMADKVIKSLSAIDSAMSAYTSSFFALLELPVNEPEWHALGAKQQRRRILQDLQRLFILESQRQPLLLIFEDLHWIDSETQSLLDELVDQLPGNRLLLLVDYRPEYNQQWSNRSFYQQVRLDPLPNDSAQTLLDTLLGDNEQLQPLRDRLIEHSAGNPLFLEESVRALVETGVIDGQAGQYQLAGKSDDISLPPTLQALIAQRIDRLDPEHKYLLQSAAVIGTNVPLTLLQAITDGNKDTLQEGLSALQEGEFLLAGQLYPEPEYRFKHAHTHQVTYEGLLQEQRRRLHALVANAMQEIYPQRRTELAEKLAEHCENGGLWKEAIELYQLAARKGKSKCTFASARDYALKALDLTAKLPDDYDQPAAILTLLGDLASLRGELDPANEYYDKAQLYENNPVSKQGIANRIHQRRFAERDGAKIAYYEHGSAEQTLLLIRPLAYNVAVAQPVVESLCQDFRVVTLDPRGTGESDPIPEEYTVHESVADIAAVITDLNRGPVIAVGLSTAARQVAWLGYEQPQLLDKIVCVAVAPDGRPWDDAFRMLSGDSEWSQFSSLFNEGDFSQFEAFLQLFAKRQFPEPEAFDFAQDFMRWARSVPQKNWHNFLKPDSGHSIRAILPGISVPTLILQGALDQLVPLKLAIEVAEQITGSQLYVFEDKGHQLMFTATAEFCDVVSEFAATGIVKPSRQVEF